MKCSGNGLSRRIWIQVGVRLGWVSALSLADMLRYEAFAEQKYYDSKEGTAKSSSLFFLPGGMAHQESFDPKPSRRVETEAR